MIQEGLPSSTRKMIAQPISSPHPVLSPATTDFPSSPPGKPAVLLQEPAVPTDFQVGCNRSMPLEIRLGALEVLEKVQGWHPRRLIKLQQGFVGE